jgi:hypothetical protein
LGEVRLKRQQKTDARLCEHQRVEQELRRRSDPIESRITRRRSLGAGRAYAHEKADQHQACQQYSALEMVAQRRDFRRI